MPKDKPKQEKETIDNKRVISSIAFWLVAVGTLLILLYLTLKFIIPHLEEPQPSKNPNLTETIYQAMLVIESRTPATSTPTNSPTPLPSRTPIPTFTPSNTPLPSPSPTSTPSPLPPTLTPAYPVSTPSTYQLVTWDATYADKIIHYMEAYPVILRQINPSLSAHEFNKNFYYATLLQAEAILRFPNAPQIDNWQWDYAYNLLRVKDTRALSRYRYHYQTKFTKEIAGCLSIFTQNLQIQIS